MPSSGAVCSGPNDYYVLLRWIEKEKRFEGFMLTGAEERREIVQCEEEDPWNIKQRSVGKPTWATVYVGNDANGKGAR
jgi:hypothetical protein